MVMIATSATPHAIVVNVTVQDQCPLRIVTQVELAGDRTFYDGIAEALAHRRAHELPRPLRGALPACRTERRCYRQAGNASKPASSSSARAASTSWRTACASLKPARSMIRFSFSAHSPAAARRP